MLTDARIRNAEKKDKNYKLTDAGGLYLFVSTAGSKRWRLKYRFGDKEQLLSLGSYPEVSLKEARQKRDEARAQLKQGKDPGAPARQARLLAGQSGNLTFESLAHEWHSIRKDTWKPVHANDVITSLQRDVFPALGSFLVTDITEPMVLAVLQKVERRGAIETAARLRQRISAVFTYAQAKGAGNRDPAEKLKIAMKRVPKAKRRPALVTIPELQRLIREVESAGAHPLTLLASRFIALTAQRQGNVRHMRWEQIEGVDFLDPLKDASAAIWRIPASEMKQDQDQRGDADFDHIVPLAPAAVEVLRVAYRLSCRATYVFPASNSPRRAQSENAVGFLYKRLGYQGRHCVHGWRSSFSTIMNERLAARNGSDQFRHFQRKVIDLMLAHMPAGLSEVELRYNRAAYMDTRREIADEWANLLLEGLPPAVKLLEAPRRRYRD